MKRTTVRFATMLVALILAMACALPVMAEEALTGSEYGEIGYALKQAGEYELAVRCFKLGVELGDGESMLQLGECYTAGYAEVDEGEDIGQVVEQLWLDAWDAGTSRGYFDLGLAYLSSCGLSIPGAGSGSVLGLDDPEKGFDYLLQAAEVNDGKAPRYVGICYENGYGVEQSYEKAAEWYIKSEATFYLGRFNLLGIGMEQDIEAGVSYLDKQARSTGGNRTESMNSKLILAELYYTGTYSEELQDGSVATATVPVDLEKGLEYYQLAIEDGNTDPEIAAIVEAGIDG